MQEHSAFLYTFGPIQLQVELSVMLGTPFHTHRGTTLVLTTQRDLGDSRFTQ